MADVITLDVQTRLDIPPERVLEGAAKVDLESVVIIGCEQDGTYYIASSEADSRDILWLLEIYRHHLMESQRPTDGD